MSRLAALSFALLWHAFAVAAPLADDCQASLGEKQILIAKLREASARHLAPIPEFAGTRFEKRIDRILFEDMAKEFRGLSSERQDQIVWYIAHAKVILTDDGLPQFQTTASFGPETSVAEPYANYLSLTGALNDHPLQRVYLRHETVHVRRLDAGVLDPEKQRMFWVRNWILRKGGLLLEERAAFLRQRWYLRRVFKRSDLPELRKLFPVEDPALVAELKEQGAIFASGEYKLYPVLENLTDPVIREKYRKAARGKLNREFLHWVEGALLTPKEKYVREALRQGGYRRSQRAIRWHSRISWQNTLRIDGMTREQLDEWNRNVREGWKKKTGD